MKQLIGAVIVNWNSCDDTLAAITSLRQESSGMPIVLVDNGSADGSAQRVQAAFPDVLVLALRYNVGLAEACNLGIEHLSEVQWIFLLNNDAAVSTGSIGKLCSSAVKADAQIGMIQPRIEFESFPGIINSSGIEMFANARARDRSYGEKASSASAPSEIFCSTAGASLYRRSMLDSVKLESGWLDRNFFMYFEDVDLGWRCRLAGWRALYVPDAVVGHKFQASSKKRGNKFVIDQCRANRVIALLKNASWHKVLTTLPVTLKDNIKSTYVSGLGHLWGILRRIPAALRDRRVISNMQRVSRRALEKRWMTSKQTRVPDFSFKNENPDEALRQQ